MRGWWPAPWTNPSRMWVRVKQSRSSQLKNMAFTLNTFKRNCSAPSLLLRLGVLCCVGVWQTACFAQDALFTGQWQGVWHIGMSSGKVMLRLNDPSQGVIAFTNLQGFAHGDTVLQKASVEGQSLLISVQSEQSNVLTARLQRKPNSKTLEGMGQYGGAGVKFELQQVD